MNFVRPDALGMRFLPFFLLALVVFSGDALAVDVEASDVAGNITIGFSYVPAMLSAIAYILGLALGVIGVLQVKDHVENPTQKPLKDGIIRVVAAGAFLSLPMLTEVLGNAFGMSDDVTGGLLYRLNRITDHADLDTTTIAALTDSGGIQVNDVVDAMLDSFSSTPVLVPLFCYISAFFFAITGVLKVRDHVTSPQQVALSSALARLGVAGAFFALPMLLEVTQNIIGLTGLDVEVSDTTSLSSTALLLSGTLSGFGGLFPDVNHLVATFLRGIDALPGLIAAFTYFIGLIIVVIGVLKIKSHVENPNQAPLKDGVITVLLAAALLAMPTIYNVMFNMVGGSESGSILAGAVGLLGATEFFNSSYAGFACNPFDPAVSAAKSIGAALGMIDEDDSGASLGGLLCGVVGHTGMLQAFISGLAYLMGLIFGVWGVFKLRDHVINPQQVRLNEGVTRLVAGGMFFAFPFIVEVVRGTIGAGFAQSLLSDAGAVTGYNDGTGGDSFWDSLMDGLGLGDDEEEGTSLCGSSGDGDAAVGGLDCMLMMFVNDIMGPIHIILNYFSFLAGSILIFIGISRLIRSAQDGPRGPGGIGTVMTFVVGGALISYNEFMFAFSGTLFGNPTTATNAVLQYTEGMEAGEIAASHVVITSILKFVILIGLISFVRGLFIIRSVAEGNQQASMMAGVTHIVAGAVAVNLGPLINAVQSTLGITGYGIAFS